MATVQMNVRIDAELKVRGDRALAEMGYTPTQVVRLVWELAAGRPEQKEMLLDLFRAAKSQGAAELAKRQRKLAAAERGWHILNDFSPSLKNLPPISDEELLLEALAEKHGMDYLIDKEAAHELAG